MDFLVLYNACKNDHSQSETTQEKFTAGNDSQKNDRS